MATYQELLAQREALEAQIKEARATERAAVIAHVREAIKKHGLTEKDLRLQPNKVIPLPPMYRDPATGATWNGRGRPPKWIAGQDYEAFLILE